MTAPEPGSLTIEEAAELWVETSKRHTTVSFELGDIVVGFVGPPGRPGAHSDTQDLLTLLAEKVGDNPINLRRYWSVALAWPPETRVPGPSFSVHRALQSVPGREAILKKNPGMTVRDATQIARSGSKKPRFPTKREQTVVNDLVSKTVGLGPALWANFLNAFITRVTSEALESTQGVTVLSIEEYRNAMQECLNVFSDIPD